MVELATRKRRANMNGIVSEHVRFERDAKKAIINKINEEEGAEMFPRILSGPLPGVLADGSLSSMQ